MVIEVRGCRAGPGREWPSLSQGVSGLNADRRGALRDARSCLFQHIPRIVSMFKQAFVWAQVHSLTESVASMDYQDCLTMSEQFEAFPWYIDSAGISLAHRPRVYWVTWELCEAEGVEVKLGSDGRLPLEGEVVLTAQVDPSHFLEPGWQKVSPKAFPTFTTARPSQTPMRKPAGLKDCLPHERARWSQDHHRFPPYQYKDEHCVVSSSGEVRPPSVLEREVILGFPSGYSVQCLPKAKHGSTEHQDARLTLFGNSWSVPVVAWLISCLVVRLGIVEPLSLADIVKRATPGCSDRLQNLLLRPPVPPLSPSVLGSFIRSVVLCH